MAHPLISKRGVLMHVITEIFDELQEVCWPTRCVNCDAPGFLMCPDCREKIVWVDQGYACNECGAPFGFLTCTECQGSQENNWISSGFDRVMSACLFEKPIQRAITVYKDGGDRRISHDLAHICMQPLKVLEAKPHDLFDAIVYIPNTISARARRGFDHMEWIARDLSEILNIPVMGCLEKLEAKDMRSLSRIDRELNVQGRCLVHGDVSRLSLLLIDDVITTGSTLREAGRVLKAAGVASLVGLSVARVM